MARQIKQFRYYGENSSKNYPNTVKMQTLQNGSAFANYYPIVQLGIQTLPGTKFTLNNAEEPIIVGYTGIYELDLDGNVEINRLEFDLYSLQTINELNDGILLVDIIYDNNQEVGG